MATLRIQDLGNLDFEINKAEPPLVQGKALQDALAVVRSKHIFVEFDRTIDGPQTAARQVREAMAPHGATIVSPLSEADAAVLIGGTPQMMFAFVVFDPRDNIRRHHCYLCSAQELTAAILTTVALYFRVQSTSHDAASILFSISELNRDVLDRISVGGPGLARGKIKRMAGELLRLRGSSDLASIKAATDALADSARVRGHGGLDATECDAVYDAASTLLVEAGTAARLFVSRLAHDADPVIAQAFRQVVARIDQK